MDPVPGEDVFDRLQSAIDAAKVEEAEFADEITAEEPESRSAFLAIAQWADSAFQAGQSLQPSEGLRRLLADEFAEDSARALAELPFIRPYLDIRMAEDGLMRMKSGAERLIALLDALIPIRLSRRAEDYLARVARLYIWGFDEEAIALAAAVLETALEDRIGEEPNPTKVNERGVRSAAKLIEFCGPRGLGLLTGGARRDAHQLRSARNDIIHNVAGSQALGAVDAVRILGEVLAQLFRGRDG